MSAPPPMSRTTALGGLALVLAGLLGVGLGPHLVANGIHDGRAAKGELLDGLRRQAGARARLEGERSALKGAAPKAATLPGKTSGVASAGLQEHMDKLARRHGLGVASVQVLPSRPAGEFTEVAAVLVMRGSLTGLAALLHELETGAPFLFVDEIRIRSEEARREGGGPRQPIRLEISVKVRGYGEGGS